MQYGKYYKRISIIANILKTVKRFRVLIISVVSVCLALVSGYLGIQGHVYDEIECPASFVYGEELTYEASAVFGDVSYQFSKDASFTEFSETPPVYPGTYYVRAVSESSFGNPRYGDAHGFTVLPKTLDVKVAQQSIMYGDTPTVTAELLNGDKVWCTDFVYDDISLETTNVAPVKESIVIRNANGDDITYAYNINPVKSEITFGKREITVTVDNAEHTYDGAPFEYDVYELTAGSLANDGTDILVGTFKDTITDAGTKDNIPTFVVISKDGIDMSIHYKVNIIKGILTVNKRPLKIEITDKEFVYDGTEHSNTEYSISEETSLVDGHKVELNTFTKAINSGKTNNVLTFNVFDTDGNDKTDNYSIIVQESFLNVLKREISVTTGDGEWVYDGEQHGVTDFEITSDTKLADTDSAEATGNTLIRDVNTVKVENMLSLLIENSKGEDVTSNYEITYTYGELNVTKKSVEIATDSETFVYNGKPRSNLGYTISDKTPLVDGHTSSVDTFTTITNVSEGNVDNIITLTIKNGNEDVTNNYEVSVVDKGILKVIPLEVTLAPNNETKVYDGTELLGKTVNDAELLDGHDAIAKFAGAQKSVGSSSVHIIEGTLEIWDGESQIELENYDITYVSATLTVTKRYITVQTDTDNWIYDDIYHSNKNVVCINDTTLANGHTTETVAFTKVKYVSDGPTDNILEIIVKDEKGVDVSENYDITYKYGTLSITKRSVDFRSKDGEWVYDDKFHSQKDFDLISDVSVVDGHTAVIDNYTEIKYVLDTPTDNIFSVKILDKNSQDVSENYDISYDFGTVEITPLPITLITATDKWIYDGESHSRGDYTISDSTPLVDGHISYATYFETVTEVKEGTKTNKVIIVIWDGSKDVTSNYKITNNFGTIKVEPYSITVRSGSKSFEYDGSIHDWLVVESGTPLIGDHIIVESKGSTVENVWDSNAKNDVEFTIVTGDGSYDVTTNYAINYIYGTLNVTPRPITVATESYEWQYDAEPHSWKKYVVDSTLGLVDGHTLSIKTYAEITEIGSIPNAITVKVMCNNKDYSENYNISYSYGLLTVTRRDVFVYAESDSKEYDGTPLICDKIRVENLLSFHNLTANTLGEITNVGIAPNVVVDGSVKITTHTGADASQYYNIHRTDGQLTVIPRKITITTGSDSKEYDGTPLTCPEHSITSEKALVLDHYYSLNVTGSITNVGVCDNTVDKLSFLVLNGEGIDMTFNYDPEYKYGQLEIIPRKITVSTGSAEKVYDGTPLVNNDAAVLIEGTLVDGHRLNLYGSGSITDVGEDKNYCAGTILDADDNDVTENYDIMCEYGTLTVTQREITIKTEGASKLYDETPLVSDGSYSITEGTLVDGHTITVLEKPSITDIGVISNTYKLSIADKNGIYVTANYKMNFDAGELEIKPHAVIQVVTGSSKKKYDGKPLSNSQCSREIIEGELLSGHSIRSLKTVTQITEVGAVFNQYKITIVDASGKDVSKYYLIKEKLGILCIYDKPIPPGLLVGSSIDTSGGGLNGPGGRPPTGPVMHVTSAISGRVYFKYCSFGDFTGQGWLDPLEYDKYLDDVYSFNYLTSIALSNAGYVKNRIHITNNVAVQTFLPYYIAMENNDIKQSSDVVYTGGLDEYSVNFYAYDGYGNDLVGNLGEYSDEELLYRAFVYANYTSIDEETKTFLDDIISANGFDKSDEDIIEKVAEYIRNAAVYNMGYDFDMDEDDNVIIKFLGEYKEGICQHFAASATMLYRALGIPARYCIGYVGDVVANKVTDVTGEQAHAWTEVYIDGVGWIPVEVTGSGFNTGEGSGDGEGEGEGEGEAEKPEGDKYGGNIDDSGNIDGGNVSDGDAPIVIEFKSAIDGPVYFRYKSFGSYTGNGWLPAVEYNNLLDSRFSYNYLSGIALKNSGVDSAPVDIKLYSSQLPLPYYLPMDDFNYDIQESDVTYSGAMDEFSLEYYFYTGSGKELVGNLGEYTDEELAYREFVYANYLEIDDATKAYMDGIISKKHFDAKDARIIQKVAKYIQSSAVYNLKYDRSLDKSENVVIAFLDEYKEGICQHYAAAATMLFRALGIPARWTLGYSGYAIAGEWASVTTEQAHAWVEVYIDGVGWIYTEVTGASAGGEDGGSGGGGKNMLVIRPVDVDKEYDGTPLYAKNELAVDYGSLLEALLDKGYTYEVTVSGSQTEKGEGFSTIESFKLIDDKGNDVTDRFVIIKEPGLVSITKPQIVIWPYSNQKYYDGKPLEYAPDDFFVVKIPDGLRVEFELIGSITDAGVLSEDDIKALPITVYDSENNDVTEDYYIKFEGDFLRIDKRSITIKSKSASKTFDGEALVCNEVYISGGQLCEGHTLVAETSATITVEGKVENTINKETLAILDADGNDVTKNYNIEIVLGTLTILP